MKEIIPVDPSPVVAHGRNELDQPTVSVSLQEDLLCNIPSEYLVRYLQDVLRTELGLELFNINYAIVDPSKFKAWYARMQKEKQL